MIAPFGSRKPEIATTAYVAPNATIIGSVTLEDKASVWFNAVIRGDNDVIVVGRGSNIQDGAILHTDASFELRVGKNVTVGHKAMLHGCTVEDDSLIGINAVILNGARIGRGSLIAAGALVGEGVVIPPGSLVKGIPGKVARPLTAEEQNFIHQAAKSYQDKIAPYKAITAKP